MLEQVSIFKLFLREVLPRALWRKLSFLKWYFFSKGSKKLTDINFIKGFDNAVVLGNGPSLIRDLESIEKLKEKSDFICVNNFCTSSYFTILKPNKYIFLDGYFFSSTAHSDWITQREKTFDIINRKTEWKMQIFLPPTANEKILKDKIKNKNVEIIKMKVFGFNPDSKRNAIRKYKKGIWGPVQCNVLIYAIYLAVWSKYKNINVFGADMSFHNDVCVNQEHNALEIRFRHFNKEDSFERLMKNPEKIHPFTMAELMQTTADTFRSHELVSYFAQHNGVKILNCSSFSMIDAYQRPCSQVSRSV